MASLAWASRQRRLLAWAVSVALGLVVLISGLGVGLERALDELDAGLRGQPASGSLHIVEIDARSIAAIDRWPWPRDNYAALVDQLRGAGAASVVFDVDFSAHSDPAHDAAFAAALERLGGRAVLPTFGQEAGGGEQGWTESLPIPSLRENALLAAVGVYPDSDGAVRRAPLAIVTGGVARPALSAVIAAASGTVGQDFPIDFAIDPDTIPRHSFIDIRDGRFTPSSLAGKDVLIGATAIEMGDRYVAPGHGVLPGVVIHGLAAETLLNGRPVELGALPGLLAAMAMAWLVLGQKQLRFVVAAITAGPLLMFGASVAAAASFHGVTDLVPGLAVLTWASISAIAIRLLEAAEISRMHDLQTGLPNRLALSNAKETPDAPGLIVARFSGYDQLAAALGDKAVGDLILRVRDRVRLVSGDAPVYRAEDRILAWYCQDEGKLLESFATLRTLMLSPIEIAGRRVDVSLVFGFAPATADDRPEAILASAMLAAEKAVTAGEPWQIHDARAGEEAERDVSLLGELDEAMHAGEILVFYQPKLCLKSSKIIGVEALVRWNHRTRGFLPPDMFIPLAERNDRIAGLTLHVVEQTMRDLAFWHGRGHDISAAVNLSAKLLASQSFLADLERLVTSSGVPAAMLTFEVTESAAMTETSEAARALRHFQALGIGISMDDYGTGQSTLSYIKQLPLTELKIDRSFVQFAHQNRSDGVLVQSTVNLAHELGLMVVAEGVETEECLAFLTSIGCDMAQGYLISRPIPAAAVLDVLNRQVLAA